MSKLYVVATPIGNLGDISARAIAVLNEVDFIACEDTRVSVKLFNHCEIKKPLVSYFEHNKEYRGKEIIERMKNGESCAIVTDAGTPCISDPGQQLVRQAQLEKIEVVGVPGANAAVTAVSISGILNNRFAFEGFLPDNAKQRIAHLESVKTLPHTLVFYVSPHKIRKTLVDLLKVLNNREVTICRELTKKFEETIFTTLEQAVLLYENKEPKGEFVLVVEGAKELKEKVSLEQAVQMAKEVIEKGRSKNESSKEVAAKTGIPKREIYKQLI